MDTLAQLKEDTIRRNLTKLFEEGKVINLEQAQRYREFFNAGWNAAERIRANPDDKHPLLTIIENWKIAKIKV